MPAAWAGAAAAVAGPLISGAMGSGAAGTQAGGANAAAQVQQNMFNTTQSNLAPWIQGGQSTQAALMAMLGIGPNSVGNPGQSPLTESYATANGAFNFDPTTIANNPQYQWQLQQGTQGVLNNSSALGGVGGNTLQALMGYGQGLASQNYNNYFANALNSYNTNANAWTNSQNQIYNMLNGQSTVGQNAAANLGSQSVNVGGQIGGDLIGAANATAAGQVGAGNALSGGLNNAGNALMYQQMANNPSYTNPAQGIGNWLSGANYNGMMPNVSTAGSAIDGGFGGTPY